MAENVFEAVKQSVSAREDEKAQETKQEKPSIRDQLKAAAKSQPEKKAPAKQKSHDIGLE